MVVVVIVASTVVVVVVVKVMVRATSFIDMGVVVEELLIDMRADAVIGTLSEVEIVVVAVVLSALKFVVSVSLFIGVLSGMVVDALIDTAAGVIMGFVSAISVFEAVADANVSLVIDLEFVISEPVKEYSC